MFVLVFFARDDKGEKAQQSSALATIKKTIACSLAFVFAVNAARAQYYLIDEETFDTLPLTDLQIARSDFSCEPSTSSTTGAFDPAREGTYRHLELGDPVNRLGGWQLPSGGNDGTAPPTVNTPSGKFFTIKAFNNSLCSSITDDFNGNGRGGELACVSFPNVPPG